MMSYDFQTITHGKWILAGEHAVVRGHPALVFPIYNKQLILSYTASQSTLSADYAGEAAADIHLLFWSVLEQALAQLGHSINRLSGQFHLENNIPIGAGMGASAALCVAVSRWLLNQQWIDESQIYSFSKNLENIFHGQSSGLDIAGVSSETGVFFKQGAWEALSLAWQPQWYLSSCSQIGITSHCIQQVQALWKDDPKHAEQIDLEMEQAVIQAKEALESNQEGVGDQLAKAITAAGQCFQKWGLVSESLESHMKQLINLGAKAVKPTGSGQGGYVVSLWDKAPPKGEIEFIAVYTRDF